MKKIFASFGWILLLLPLISIAGARTAYNTLNNNITDSEYRQVGSFTSVSSAGAFDVRIKFGTKESLKLEGNRTDLEKIETVVENGDLKIRYKKRQGNALAFKGSDKVTVFITAKSLNGFVVSGSGDMKVEGPVQGDKIQSRLSGSGSLSLNLDVISFTSMISGSGKINASGNAKTTNVALSGSGMFNGEKLRTDNANIKVSGSGDASIYAEDTLNAAVSGSGEILYAGNAKVYKTTTGSGKVSKL